MDGCLAIIIEQASLMIFKKNDIKDTTNFTS